MTGMALSRSRSFLDFDTRRNQEWLRRRKLRLEQVRKQSNEIAKALREKILNHEKERLQEYERLSETKLQCWKAEKLDELERKLMCALEEFGEGYKEAEEEPDPEGVLLEQNKINFIKAQDRGEIARQVELKRRKIAEENKMAVIERKKLIRKKEDLRSALVLSIPVKKQIIEKQTACEEKVHPEKFPSTPVKHTILAKDPKILVFPNKQIHGNKVRKKRVSPAKCCSCKKKGKNPETHSSSTIWVNLNELQNSSEGNSRLQPTVSKSTEGTETSQKKKPEGAVEFYDFSSRYYCKSFKEYPHLVERIDPGSEVLSAHDMAEKEDEEEKVKAKKKVKADAVSQERGMEALKREKINQDYNNLIAKLEELNRKEKMLKTQQRILPSCLHMNDERLHERLRMKQRIMDSKFENICYEAISQVPRPPPPRPTVLGTNGGGDCDGRVSNRLSFSPGRLRTNTPVTTDGEASEEAHCERTFWERPKKIEKRTQLIINIDKTLKEGRELRKAISKTREPTSAEGEEEKQEENGGTDSEEAGERKAVLFSPRKDEKTTKCQESQTDDLKGNTGVTQPVFVMSGDDSLPVSTATSYKSPPSVIRSYRLHQFLEYLEGVSEMRGNILLEGYSGFCKSTKDSFQRNDRSTKLGEAEEGRQSPTLEYYIEKLLDMSRERIAELSVSSEYVSTPNVTDVDTRKSISSDLGNLCSVSSKGEELVRKSRLERADHLGKTIKNWKLIFEKNSKDKPEGEDVLDGPCGESIGGKEIKGEECEVVASPISNPKIMRKYKEITKKCSERISELSVMLDKVRKEKEKLLSSTSGGSSLSSNKGGENSEEEAVVPVRKEKLVDDFFNRQNQSTCGREVLSTVTRADSQSPGDLKESLESWPDVMDELLKRNILSSPFKWSDVDYSSEITTASGDQTKPSSIETVIGSFRKEIDNLKPFTVSDSFPVSSVKAPYFEEKYRALLDSPKEKDCSYLSTTENGHPFQEGSSVESINHALTTLGLNWAKSFLRKNEESKAISSSSNSERESSGNEADYP